MKWFENEVYLKLQDDESKKIYEAKCKYLVDRDNEKLENSLFELNIGKYRLNEWIAYKKTNSCSEGIVIWGAGNDGIRTYKLLKEAGEKIVAFGDNFKCNSVNPYVDGLKVHSIDEIYRFYSECTQVIATRGYVQNIYEQLLGYGFNRTKIFYPMYRRIMAACGKQYFDCPGLVFSDEEVFLDCGSLNAMTSVAFANEVNRKYKKIITFDPDKKCENTIKNNIEKYNLSNIEFIKKGLADFEGEIRFNSNGNGSSNISEEGKDSIEVTTIDKLLNGERATFIKMDIEGAELGALRGAKNTITKYHPKLAISIYHKIEDIVEIPEFILECYDGYKLYIRHYSSCEQETVLYAY